MKYGTPIYRQCVHCGFAIEIRPLIEGSHDGSLLWTDGYIESTTMPEQAILARCGNCAEVVWLSDLNSIEDPETDQVTGYRGLTADDYLSLVEDSSSLNKEHTVVLRTLAWQKSNQARRGAEAPEAYSAADRRNMQELDALLTEEWENELLMKIEIARELGDFRKAARLMRDVDFSTQVRHLADQLKQLVKKKDSAVTAFKTKGLGAR